MYMSHTLAEEDEDPSIQRLKYIQLQAQFDTLKKQYQELALSSESSSELVANKLMHTITNLKREKSSAEHRSETVQKKLQETLYNAVQTHQLLEAEQESISLQLQKKIEEEKRQRKELEGRLQQIDLTTNVVEHIKQMMSVIRGTEVDKQGFAGTPEDDLEGDEEGEKSVLVELNESIHKILERSKALQDENSVLRNRVSGLNDELYLKEKRLEQINRMRKAQVESSFLLEVGDEHKFNEHKRLSISSNASSTISGHSLSTTSNEFGTSVSDSESARQQQIFHRILPSPLQNPILPTVSREDLAFETLKLDTDSVASVSSQAASPIRGRSLSRDA